MAHVANTGRLDAPRAPAAAVTEAGSYIDWPAILAGALLTTAISFVLFAFGGALGLTMVSPEGGEGASLRWLAIAAGLWFIWVVISSSIAGGYVAGRMRRRTGDATADKSDTRDGINGLVVWAAATLIGAMLATSGVSTVVRGASAAAGAATTAVSSVAGGATGALAGDADYFAGLMQRGEGTALGNPDVRAEISGILARSLQSGTVSDADRSYIVTLVANESGTTPEAVEARVQGALDQLAEAREKAVQAAEAARVAGVISAFLIAATLMSAGAASYFAAVMGGDHRDRNITFRSLR